MTYAEYREAAQAEFNKLPIFWAFSNMQFKEALEKRGIDTEGMELGALAKKYVYRFGDTGGFYLKTDAQVVREYLQRDHAKELGELMENDLDFAREAFVYEMENHEYPINWQGDWDVCTCFGNVEYDEMKDGTDYLLEMGYSPDVVNVYREARREVMSRDY